MKLVFDAYAVDVTGLLMFIKCRVRLSASVTVTPVNEHIIVLFVNVITAFVYDPCITPFTYILHVAT